MKSKAIFIPGEIIPPLKHGTTVLLKSSKKTHVYHSQDKDNLLSFLFTTAETESILQRFT